MSWDLWGIEFTLASGKGRVKRRDAEKQGEKKVEENAGNEHLNE